MAAVTLTLSVQPPASGIVPPVKLTVVLPGVAVAVPPQLVPSAGDAATVIPVGRASTNATPVCGTVLTAGLVMVNVRLVVPFTGTAGTPKALAITAGATTTRGA